MTSGSDSTVLVSPDVRIIHQFLGLVGVHAGRRLIQQQELGIGRHGPGDLQLTLGAVRQVGSQDTVSVLIQIKYPEQLIGLLIHLLFHAVIGRQAEYRGQGGISVLVMQAHFDIVQNGQLLEQADVLESTGYTGLVDLHRRPSGNVLAVQADDTFIGFVFTGQQVKNGRLAGAVGRSPPKDMAR